MRTSIQIFAILFVVGVAAVYLPVIGNLKTPVNGKRSECLSNTKWLAIAMLAYATDNEGHFPPASQWMDQIESQFHGEGRPTKLQAAAMYKVDSDFHAPPTNRTFDDPLFISKIPRCPLLIVDGEPTGFGYAFNRDLSGAVSANSPTTPLIFESQQTQRNASGTLTDLPRPGRHDGKSSVSYEDGHIRLLTDTQPNP